MKRLVLALLSMCVLGCTDEEAYEMLHPTQVHTAEIVNVCHEYVGEYVVFCFDEKQNICEDKSALYK